MKIVPKLNLNMSPQAVEENSLVFARNMKIDKDGNIINDYGYENIDLDLSTLGIHDNANYVGHIVGLNNKIYLFYARRMSSGYRFYYINCAIVEYDEITENATLVNAKWTYAGGKIDGAVTTNITGETILTIAENKEGVPLKHINLSHCSSTDNESVYCQAPEIPICNLKLVDTYVKTIPNGTYVFFIRYKIRKDVYTNWQLCSRPIFGGTNETSETIQGGLKYINMHKDSAKSFVFSIDFIRGEQSEILNYSSYEEFQLGFIITHDEATDARIWKSFNLDECVETLYDNEEFKIYFDYEDIKEANVDDFIKPTYELYKVGNITNYKNKLYISNYKESNVNEDLSSLVNNIDLDVEEVPNTFLTQNNKLRITGQNPIDYDYDYKKYPISNSILNNFTFYNFNMTKLAKVESKEISDVLSFDIKWNSSNNPDIASVYNIKNNLNVNGYLPFGNSALNTYDFECGLNLVASLGNQRYYQRASTDNKHPWDDLGFTFAYGSLIGALGSFPYRKKDVYLINKNSNVLSYNGYNNLWIAADGGFPDENFTAVEENVKAEIKNLKLFKLCYLEIYVGAKTYIYPLSIPYNDDKYISTLVTLTYDDYTTGDLSSAAKNRLFNYFRTELFDHINGVDEYGVPIITKTVYDPVKGNNVTLTFKTNCVGFVTKLYGFEVSDILDNGCTSDDNGDPTYYDKTFKVSMNTTEYKIICNYEFNPNKVNISNDVVFDQQSTLMIYSKYQPYIHFVDNNHIVQNGIKYPSKIVTGNLAAKNNLLKLKYKVTDENGDLGSSKYNSFFITLENVGDIVIESFNYKFDSDRGLNIIQVLESDALLYNLNDNITIYCFDVGYDKQEVTRKAKYYPSGSYDTPLSFGNCGFVAWHKYDQDPQVQIHSDTVLYIVIDRDVNDSKINNKLVKCSEYIPCLPTLDDEDNPEYRVLDDGFYGSYGCLVRKPDFDLSSSCYVSGNDIYNADRSTSIILQEFKGYVQTLGSSSYFIRSNFNLNYLSLTEDINDKIFSVGSAASGVKQVAKVLNSLILSSIYELKSMYREFANKYFSERDSDYVIKFDNTIRVSNVLSDETFNNSVFKFEPENYYNVPADRGTITKLFHIGDAIYLHCIHALYKFDAKQTIKSTESDISLQEAEPFDIGLVNVLDSEKGYAGLSSKESGCVTFDSYFFYDKLSNHIFGYGGNGQFSLIDDTINRLLDYYKPIDCRTLHDDKNNRILFELMIDDSDSITLSYNYKYKSFISCHDITLDKSFSTRIGCYYATDREFESLFKDFENDNASIDTTIIDATSADILNIQKLYGNASHNCYIEFGSTKHLTQVSPFNIAIVCLAKQNIIEVLNSISYIADIQRKAVINETNYDAITSPNIHRAEGTPEKIDNPVLRFYAVTDSCISSIVNTNTNDSARPNSLEDYKGFKYEKGIWTCNYFRNILNNVNIYQYPDNGYSGLSNDNDSLVYGRYFILVFDFLKDIPIKFEEIFINSNIY